MKTQSNISTVIAAKAAIMIAGLFMMPIQYLSAQSADLFQSLGDTTKSVKSDNLPKSTPDIELLKSKPSRFAAGNIELYTAARMADFSMKNRSMDVFGLYQDPDFKPVINNVPTAIKKGPTNIVEKPLIEIIQGIKVSTIMIKEKSFLVGDSAYKEAEEFTITKDGRTKNLKVIKVEPNQIIFKDLNTKEEATLKIEVLPPGMLSGGDKIRPAGMSSSSEKKHIDLEIE